MLRDRISSSRCRDYDSFLVSFFAVVLSGCMTPTSQVYLQRCEAMFRQHEQQQQQQLLLQCPSRVNARKVTDAPREAATEQTDRE